ncbi:hypothetical protein RND71_033060 [Anisodus tanguticus]|uniref:Hydroxyproline-rich glycoprotein family protein n=1 Tax=Anisodus tanguticus TaxID=243964 RepID=A0AAE1V143_9SOLA|nr:hypothetical protein RND71_033060 [Anisodus tanguticus]
MTENKYYAPPHSDASRPSLGFPLGTALLLLIIFSLSGIFSCCYHWDKVRSLRRSFSEGTDLEAGGDPSYLKSKRAYMHWKQNQVSDMPAVLMPGDEVPKFIALPCPCQPPRPEKLVDEVQHPPLSPIKPPDMAAAVPSYQIRSAFYL